MAGSPTSSSSSLPQTTIYVIWLHSYTNIHHNQFIYISNTSKYHSGNYVCTFTCNSQCKLFFFFKSHQVKIEQNKLWDSKTMARNQCTWAKVSPKAFILLHLKQIKISSSNQTHTYIVVYANLHTNTFRKKRKKIKIILLICFLFCAPSTMTFYFIAASLK